MTGKEYKLMQKRRILCMYGKYIMEWVHSEGEKYKNGNIFPLTLTSYYTETDDIEIASIVDMLIPFPLSEDSPKRMNYIAEMRSILGEHPSDLVRNRMFITIKPEGGEDGIVGKFGILKADLFNILDWIWEIKYKMQIPLEFAVGCELGVIKKGADEVPKLKYRLVMGISECSAMMTLMRMCANDGMGLGIWKGIGIDNVKCPMNKEVSQTVHKLYPIEKISDDNVGEILEALGFTPQCEFIYTFLACRKYASEMETIGEKLKLCTSGKMTADSWRTNYYDGRLLIPGCERPKGKHLFKVGWNAKRGGKP